jgi:NAD(P)-dependent dehydrogenase (short-subunit alcohol dehydrogenase family)
LPAHDLTFDRVFDFSGKTVLITGAANGVGLAITSLFAERSARLALLDKTPKVADVAKTLGAPVRFGRSTSPTRMTSCVRSDLLSPNANELTYGSTMRASAARRLLNSPR